MKIIAKDTVSRLVLKRIRKSAKENGADKLNLSEINKIIKKVRNESK